MCQVLEVSRSGYYAWRKRPKSQRERSNEKLLQEISDSHRRSHGIYGVRKITQELRRNHKCSKNRVHRLMKKHGIKSRRFRKYKTTTNSKHNYPVAENILGQYTNFTRPNQAWAADITYIWTKEGWMYLATVIDLCHRKIVGWAIDKTMNKELVINALNRAICNEKPPPGLIHHSDQGVQYASHAYQILLKEHGFIPSMSRKGNCYDNAYKESFFSSLKCEIVHLNNFETRKEAKNAVFEYIEIFYNRMRLHASLGYLSPLEYENRIKEILAA